MSENPGSPSRQDCICNCSGGPEPTVYLMSIPVFWLIVGIR